MHTNGMNKKILAAVSMVFLAVAPILAGAQGGFIPCDKNCGYADLFKLVNNVIDYLIMISIPLAAGVFAWAGFKYMSTGVVDQKKAATEMIQKVFIGFVFILAAWIIVNTITNTLLKPEFREAVPVEGTKKN
jgi:hypothetical protein